MVMMYVLMSRILLWDCVFSFNVMSCCLSDCLGLLIDVQPMYIAKVLDDLLRALPNVHFLLTSHVVLCPNLTGKMIFKEVEHELKRLQPSDAARLFLKHVDPQDTRSLQQELGSTLLQASPHPYASPVVNASPRYAVNASPRYVTPQPQPMYMPHSRSEPRLDDPSVNRVSTATLSSSASTTTMLHVTPLSARRPSVSSLSGNPSALAAMSPASDGSVSMMHRWPSNPSITIDKPLTPLQQVLEILAAHPIMTLLGGHPGVISIIAPLYGKDKLNLVQLFQLLQSQSVDQIAAQANNAFFPQQGLLESQILRSVKAIGERSQRKAPLLFAIICIQPAGALELDLDAVWSTLSHSPTADHGSHAGFSLSASNSSRGGSSDGHSMRRGSSSDSHTLFHSTLSPSVPVKIQQLPSIDAAVDGSSTDSSAATTPVAFGSQSAGDHAMSTKAAAEDKLLPVSPTSKIALFPPSPNTKASSSPAIGSAAVHTNFKPVVPASPKHAAATSKATASPKSPKAKVSAGTGVLVKIQIVWSVMLI